MTDTRKALLVFMLVFAVVMFLSRVALAQTDQYKKKSKAEVAAPAKAGEAVPAKGDAKPGDKGAKTDAKASDTKPSDKLDITELEQKYWAPKDTDFSVVQNRTYTKAKRFSLSLLTGPLVNDPFNSGLSYVLQANYYTDERTGFEFTYISSDITESSGTKKFLGLSGGAVRPDFNRDVSYMGAGYNFVPFYAKMSFMGKKIIYFDMLLTPHIGISRFEQLTVNSTEEKSAFTYGVDLSQYFFFSNHFAIRATLHNRWYKQDVLAYQTGGVARSNETNNTSMVLMGFTYFF